jgi:hypothetical protein
MVNRMALADDLPDAIITESGLKITPLNAEVPDAAQRLIDQAVQLLPHVKNTELLLEVDRWTGFMDVSDAAHTGLVDAGHAGHGACGPVGGVGRGALGGLATTLSTIIEMQSLDRLRSADGFLLLKLKCRLL